jgi:predicted hydrocarbon binding protein
VAEGNSVLACFDEGSGKKEDLVGMMSLSSGVIKIKMREGKKLLNIVKHPILKPKRIEISLADVEKKELWDPKFFDEKMQRGWWEMVDGRAGAALRSEVSDFVNVFWSNMAVWSGMLWDPQWFPTMRYELIKKYGSQFRDYISVSPWYARLAFRLLPKNLSNAKNMERLYKFFAGKSERMRSSIIDLLDHGSKKDEYCGRVYENDECCVFENIGTAMAAIGPPLTAGICIAVENFKRDWNAVETKCIGLGDSYCEVKLVPGKIDELSASLEKDTLVIHRIHDRLIDRLMRFLLEGKPLIERPKLGDDVYFLGFSQATALPAIAGERYRMATRMGGARMGKKIGERLTETELGEEAIVKHILNFLEHCKVGKVTLNKTLRIRENCEGLQIKSYITQMKEPSCFFTTGFLNGFFYAVTDQHVREIKCIAAGYSYCEWEFR